MLVGSDRCRSVHHLGPIEVDRCPAIPPLSGRSEGDSPGSDQLVELSSAELS
ncbi:hypothetical protein ACFPRL_11970 [Pseudoclavibacter helvolus]